MNRFTRYGRRALCVLAASSMVLTSFPVSAASLDDVQVTAEAVNTISPISVSEDGSEYVFALKDLEVIQRWSATDVVGEDGKVTVTFPGQYNQIFYKIPEVIQSNRIVSVSIEAADAEASAKMSIKLATNKEKYPAYSVAYGSTTVNTAGEGCTLLDEGVKPSEINVIGLMNLKEEAVTNTLGNVIIKLGDEKADPVVEEKTEEEKKEDTVASATTSEVKEYTLADLEISARWNTKETAKDDGTYDVSFDKQYSQLFIKIPEEIDPTAIEKVSVETDGAGFSLKFCDGSDSHEEIGVVYGANEITAAAIKSGKNANSIKEIGFMNMVDGESVKNVGKIIFTVTKPLPMEYSYRLSELTVTDSHDYELTSGEGSDTFKSLEQYGEASYVIPEEVDLSRLASIIVNASDSSSLSVKAFSGEKIGSETEKKVVYGSNVLDVTGITTTELTNIGVMGMSAGFTTEISSVTFKMKSNEVAPSEEEKVIDGALDGCYKKDGQNNPLITQRYCADPSVMVYNDTVYIYATNDIYEYDSKGNVKSDNSYGKIKSLNCISSTDLVNWTDHGAIQVAGKNNENGGAAAWANNSWAPCAAHKTIDGKEKFFLYFADNGSGIGVLTSDSPTGPFVDPLGEQLISRKTPNCANVEWLFDPAVMVDDDGTGYLVFGGGVPSGKAANPQTARVVKLGDDMISLANDPVMIDAPYLFEDSGINKVGDTYVYTYCSNFNCVAPYRSGVIQYMTSKDPMGPYEYQGELLENPGSVFSQDGGNNHHSFFEFKDQYYIAYHARQVAAQVFGAKADYRSTQIDKVNVTVENGNAVLEYTKPSMSGVSATAYVNPYETVQAETIYRMKGLQTSGVGDTYVTDVDTGDWLGVKGVDFSKGLSKITVRARATEDTSIDVRIGSEKGTIIGNIPVKASADFTEFSTEIAGLSGTRNLYFRFKGTVEFDSWIATEGPIVDVEEADDTEVEGIQYDIPDWKDSLTAAFGEDFLAGGEVTGVEFDDEKNMALVTKHFNAITLGNELKPDSLFGYKSSNPTTEVVEFNGVELLVPELDFSRPEKILDYFVKWNTTHPDDQIKIRGHVLTWHSQTPEWFFHEDYDSNKPLVSTEVMNLRHEWFIKSVLTHFVGGDSKYKDLFYGWDVVNEAVSDNSGTYRNGNENSTWWKVYGSNEFIINAFKFANKYAPANLELYYNDYNETGNQKAQGIAQLLRDVKAAEGTRIDGFGMQGHYTVGSGPSKDQFKNVAKLYASIVDKVQLTELDFKCSSAYDGTANTEYDENTRLAYAYKDIFEAVKELRAEGVDFSGLTVWGVIDGYSWLNDSNNVGGGSTVAKKQIPLLFDRDYQAKAAYWAFVDSAKLAPSIQEISVTEKVDDKFTAGSSYTYSKGDDTEVTFVPVWDADGLSVQVTVKDSTVDESDAVTVYVVSGKDIEKFTVKRADSTEVEGGYVATVRANTANKLTYNKTVAFDVVVTNGAVKAAFNDNTLSHESSSEYFAKATLKPFMLIKKDTITIGEDNSAVWAEVAPVALGFNSGAKATATAKVLWDETNLYLQVTVVDSVLNADASAVHEKDSVEIFIDENNNKSASYEDDDKQYRVNYLNEQSFNGTNCKEENIVSNIKLTEDGYVLEAAMKWTDVAPVAGSKIGFDVQINDADNSAKRIGTLNWYDTTGNGWQSPAVFGTVILDGGKDWGDIKPVDRASYEEGQVWVAGIEDVVYNGKAQTFALRVYNDKTLLTTKDYSVKYTNNVAAAEKDAVNSRKQSVAPTVTITGKGKLSKTKIVKTFTIAKADIANAAVVSDVLAYTGSAIAPKLTFNGKTLAEGAKKDYTVTNNKAIGAYTTEFTGVGNYTGSKTVDYVITKNFINKASVSGLQGNVRYTGEALTQDKLVVKLNGKTLVQGEQYNLVYENNVEVGKATVKIVGINDGVKTEGFYGEKVLKYNVTGDKISSAKVSYNNKAEFTGNEIKPEVKLTVKVGKGKAATEVELVNDKDYTVSYEKNINAGTGYVVVTGKGLYYGTVKKAFTIDRVDIAKVDSLVTVALVNDTVKYEKNGAKVALNVMFGQAQLVEGQDFKVAYANNNQIATKDAKKNKPTVTITGIKNFKGSVKRNFTIETKDIAECGITTNAVYYVKNRKAGSYKAAVKVVDTNNKTLATSDYNKAVYTYAKDTTVTVLVKNKPVEKVVSAGTLVDNNEILPLGTEITVTVTGKGKYAGTASTTYTIVEKPAKK